MRRRVLSYAAVLTTLVVAACTDSAPTNASLTPYYRATANVTLADYIQEQIFVLLPKGFEDAVDARWATVRQKKAAGDFAGAVKQLNTLATWIDKKTAEITIPAGSTETQAQAAVRLVLNMTRWLYEGENSPIIEQLQGTDVTVEVVPAGTPADISPPSDDAAIAFGPQNEDRIIIISQEQYPGVCNGPLPTSRCQYPLFYRIESFPNTRIIGRGRFAVCLVTTGDRRPIEYPNDEAPGPRPVDERLRLAHNAPPDGQTSQGGRIEGGIEILERVAPVDQTGLVTCNEPSTANLSAPVKALYAFTRFVGSIISPKDAHAIDQGPEHYGDFTSNFNFIDPYSQPDLVVNSVTPSATQAFAGDPVDVSHSIENRSRRKPGGNGTGPNLPTTASILLFSDAALTTQVGSALASGLAVNPMFPDGPVQTPAAALNVTLPGTLADGQYYLAVRVAPSPKIADAPTAFASGEYEGDSYANNTLAVAINVQQKKADLLVESGFTVSPMEVTQGGSVTLGSWTVKNAGLVPSGDFISQFYLVSATGTLHELGGPVSHTSLAAGASAVQLSQMRTVPNTTPAGTYTVELRVDKSNSVVESNEDNNTFSVAGFKVVEPASVATTITFVDPSVSGNIFTDCNGTSGCAQAFNQGGYIVQSFWYDPPQVPAPHWTFGHFHLTSAAGNWYEAHHWQGDAARQGVRIRRQDGKAFTLASIDYQNGTSPFEIGTTAITSISGTPMKVSGYTEFPVTASSLFQTLQFSGFANVTEVWITSRNAVGTTTNWDNIVLNGPATSPTIAAIRAAPEAKAADAPQYEPARAETGQPDRIKKQ